MLAVGPTTPCRAHLSTEAAGVLDPTRAHTVDEAARGLEATFLTILLKEMRQTLGPGCLFGNDSGDVCGGLFDQFMAQHLVQGGGMGLAQSIKHQLEPTGAQRSPGQH
jgi:Rod binding domain-containing protein